VPATIWYFLNKRGLRLKPLMPANRNRTTSARQGRSGLSGAAASILTRTQSWQRPANPTTCVWRWQERFATEGVVGLLRDKTRPPGKLQLQLSAWRMSCAAHSSRHLLASGWLIANASGDWSWAEGRSRLSFDELLRSSVRYPLLMARKPPRRHGEVEMRDYHRLVAEDVARHLQQSGWTLAPALAKKPPTRPHSTPMTRA
jgi:hypothetical protein